MKNPIGIIYFIDNKIRSSVKICVICGEVKTK